MSEPIVINDRYELGRRIGRGGMAEVFVARDRLLDRPVAVKVLFPEHAKDPLFVERFRREAMSAAGLNHPNIVGVYDWGQVNNTYYIAMEYVQGRTLADILQATGRLSVLQACDIAVEVAAALASAHQHGVVHRDIKPANILVGSTGQVKVADFGIARAVGAAFEQNLTQSGAVMGTATYFSPEQAQGSQPDPRSDLYSLGVVMYEMIVGEPPFVGDNAIAVAYKQVHDQPVALRTREPDISPAFNAIVMKCLEKDPLRRYGSAGALADDIRRFVDGEEVSAFLEEQRRAREARDTSVLLSVEIDPNVTTILDAQPTTKLPTTRGARPTTDYPPYDDIAPKRTAAYVFGAVASIIAIIAIGLFTFRLLTDEGASTSITVPNVVGLNIEDARALLLDVGLTPIEDPRVRDGAANDVVYEQSPTPDTLAREGENVILVYNPGFVPVTVPNLVGLSVEQATATLRSLGLRLVVGNFVADTNIPANQILSQSPDADLGTRPNSIITVVVSGGTNSVLVPDVIGDPEAAAIRELQARPFGFVVTTVREASDLVEAGRVIRTEPIANSAAAPGGAITLYVSAGAATVEVPDFTALGEGEAQNLALSLGLQPTLTYQDVPAEDPADGRVISQSIAAGTRVVSQSQIIFVVGRVPDGI
jgi:serine/threonine protein kinase/beta-lactam-binding protein with PASTA domain